MLLTSGKPCPAEALIAENISLVRLVLYKKFPWLASDEDAFQEGCIGLIMAARDYIPGQCQFPTFAYIAIMRAIQNYLTRSNAKFRQPKHPSVSIETFTIYYLETHDPTYRQVEARLEMERLLGLCTKKERVVIDLALRGYTHREISMMLGNNRVNVSRLSGLALRKMRQAG
jgi:RNA polymerase sigma factor (sigma-70 family)